MTMRTIIAGLALLAATLPPAVPAAAEECLDCHELAAVSPGGTVVHPPFEDKDCRACHADHGEEERLVLKAEGNAVCADCHDFADAAFLGAHRKIAPTGKAACTGCHDPHRSPNRRLLRPLLHAPVKEGKCEACHRTDGKLKIPMALGFCHLCHDKKAFTLPVVHDPVKKGRCFDCHDPHGSRWRALLHGNFAEEREPQAGEGDFALCVRCHDAAGFRAGGAAKTRFVDKDGRNLHALHILPEKADAERASARKGYTCRNCHLAHAAPNAALTRTELECGSSLCMKLEYRRTDDGGECMASCHGERMRYSRPAAPPP
jgi:predicted CXXCH cytochrome family protein